MNKIYNISATKQSAYTILQYLNKKGYYLQLEKRGLHWNLYGPQNKNKKSILKIPKNLIEAIARFKWIKISAGQANITQNGKTAFKHNDPKISAITLKTIYDQKTTRKVAFNQNENVILKLNKKYDKKGNPIISLEQMNAAIKLQKDYEKAQLRQKITLNWESFKNKTQKNKKYTQYTQSETGSRARKRLQNALNYVGPELTPILIKICCMEHGLTQTETNLQIPKSSARIILQIALTRLARYYGFEQKTDKIPINHWGAQDYKPKI